MHKKERKNPQTSQLQIKLMQSEVNRAGNMFCFCFFNWKVYLFNPRVLHRGTFHAVVSL